MDWNNSLLWLVGLSAAIFAFRVVFQRPVPWGWAFVLLVVLATCGVGWFVFPSIVGYVAIAEWLLLVLSPSIAQRSALRMVNSRHPTVARWLARLSFWLHPADGFRDTRRFIDALALAQQGDREAGHELLASLQSRQSSMGRTAIAMRVRQTMDWPGFLDWMERQPDRTYLLHDPSLADVYLQSLGETGRRREMLSEYQRLLGGDTHPTAQLRVAALSGDAETVRAIASGPLQSWPSDIIDFWVATALQVQGDASAEPTFERLRESELWLIAGLAEHRLSHPLPTLGPDELDLPARKVLGALASDARHDMEFAALSSTPYRRPVITWTIAALLTINFLRELPGGAEDEDNLVALGAIIIPAGPETSQWWRTVTAAFLHFGWMHFLMNLFGLLFLGTRLERVWGWWKTLVCYAAAIAVSMTATPRLLAAASTEPQNLAGASGGIMGLLGGLLGHLLVGRWRRKTPQVTSQLSLLIGFVLLQTLFDLSHPQVSEQAHLLGLGTGCLCGVIFGLCSRRGERVEPEVSANIGIDDAVPAES